MATTEDKKLKPFEDLGFEPEYDSGDERVGACVFCGKRRKFYLNVGTQKWSCKAGACAKTGNLTTFMEEWLKLYEEEDGGSWEGLAADRGLPVEELAEAGIVWDSSQERWAIPVRNVNGRICNLRFYRMPTAGQAKKSRLMGVAGLPVELYGIEQLADPQKRAWPVWLCEGEWDGMALRLMLKRAKKKGIVVAVPGAGTFKSEWAEALADRNITAGYDAGTEGVKGTARAFGMLKDRAKSFRYIAWPDAVADGFDVRDFYQEDGDLAGLESLVSEYEPEDEDLTGLPSASEIAATYPLLKDGGRPTFEETLKTYSRYLLMTPEMVDALKIVYAVVYSTQIGDSPLWIHIVSPSGSGKTALLLSCKQTSSCVTRSTVTLHSLCSGFVQAGGKDPSLIPHLIGRAFVLKDFTEILEMTPPEKKQIYSIFRGAHDGLVEKTFGNGVSRTYEGQFSMVSGVTPAVYRDANASVGERFLMFHMLKGGSAERGADIVRAAYRRTGKKTNMKQALETAAKAFLEYRLEEDDIPEVPEKYEDPIINLAQLTAMLRANVERDFTQERVLYRPQTELATRLVVQLKTLMICLGLLNSPPSIGEAEYRLTRQVALDTCIGWNLDALREAMKYEGLTLQEIAEGASIPRSTLRDRLEDLCMLGVLSKEKAHAGGVGAPPVRYHVSKLVRAFWGAADMNGAVPGKVLGGFRRRAKAAPGGVNGTAQTVKMGSKGPIRLVSPEILRRNSDGG
jgi:hypothetical protein